MAKKIIIEKLYKLRDILETIPSVQQILLKGWRWYISIQINQWCIIHSTIILYLQKNGSKEQYCLVGLKYCAEDCATSFLPAFGHDIGQEDRCTLNNGIPGTGSLDYAGWEVELQPKMNRICDRLLQANPNELEVITFQL